MSLLTYFMSLKEQSSMHHGCRIPYGFAFLLLLSSKFGHHLPIILYLQPDTSGFFVVYWLQITITLLTSNTLLKKNTILQQLPSFTLFLKHYLSLWSKTTTTLFLELIWTGFQLFHRWFLSLCLSRLFKCTLLWTTRIEGLSVWKSLGFNKPMNFLSQHLPDT